MSTQLLETDRAGPVIALRPVVIGLFEHSDVLEQNLLPELLTTQPTPSVSQPADIQNILTTSIKIIRSWDTDLRARFVGGHPRIGETKNLSINSYTEQGGGSPTPPEVLARLAHLNACYERVYPGLRYITFVNGRSRAAIAEEMENKLGLSHCLSPNQPSVESLVPVERDGPEWQEELGRAVEDVGRIAHSRVKSVVGGQS